MWRLGLVFALGHCCIHALAQLPRFWPWALGWLAGAGIAAGARSAVAGAFLAGIAWSWLGASLRLADDLPTALERQPLIVRGHVSSLPEMARGDVQFDLHVSGGPEGMPSRIRLTWYRAPMTPQAGELWQLAVSLKRRNGFANPGGHDFEGRLFREGIGASGYVREDTRNHRLQAPSASYVVARSRAWLARRIADAVPDSPVLGVLQGLAVGDTRNIDTEQWQTFAATGTTHLMAISGLHVGMVAALAAWLGGSLVRLRGAQARGWTAAHGQVLAGVCAASVYSLLAGLSIPTQRTLVMVCIYFAARWWRRELQAAHALGLALIGVLLIDPLAPLSPGTWLSFGAVAMILAALGGRLVRDGPVKSFARVQIAITLGLAPLLVAAFGSLSVTAPAANAVAVPMFTLAIVPCVLLGALAAAVWLPAGTWMLSIPAWLLERVWPLFEWLAQQPLALWHFPAPAPGALLALAAGAVLLILPGIWPTRLAGFLLCLPALLSRPPAPAEGDLRLTLLDVGQGLAMVARTSSHVLVYDTGPGFRSGRDAAELAVLPYLRAQGIRHLDVLIVSHGDLDHRGGMASMLKALPIERVIAGPSVQGLPPGALRCRRGERWDWDGVQFEMMHPDEMAYGENDSSCVLRLSAAGGSALITGDIESSAENALLAHGLERTDVVVVPHHGSRTSSTQRLVAALAPRYALVAAGYRNRWDFPRAEVRERWQGAGARVLTTADSGAIDIMLRAGAQAEVKEHRRAHARYWNRQPPAARDRMPKSHPRGSADRRRVNVPARRGVSRATCSSSSASMKQTTSPTRARSCSKS